MQAIVRIRTGVWLALAMCAGLAGCAGPTPYRPLADGYGYSEQALEEDRYRVIFAGNSRTTRATVDNFLMYRAAEVTLARGHDHFVVVRKDIERSTSYYTTFSDLGGPHGFPGDRHDIGGLTLATARPRDRYTAYADIVLRRGETPPDDLRAHDAREVLERLRPAVEERSGT